MTELSEEQKSGKCHGFLGKIFGHSFRPVITKGEPVFGIGEHRGCDLNKIIELTDKSRPETFHGLYCRRCGVLVVSRKHGCHGNLSVQMYAN